MKPILFIDFDGVLCHDRFWRSLPREDYDRIQESFIKGNKPMMDAWMRGNHTSEEINQYLSESLSIPYEDLWTVFTEDARTMHVAGSLLEAIRDLRSRYQTVLITVNMDCFDRFTVPALSLTTYFDLIVNSYEDGRFKFEDGGSMFIDAAKKLQAPVTTAYLLDDSENNCVTFSQLGGTAFKVDEDHSTLVYLERLKKQLQ